MHLQEVMSTQKVHTEMLKQLQRSRKAVQPEGVEVLEDLIEEPLDKPEDLMSLCKKIDEDPTFKKQLVNISIEQ